MKLKALLTSLVVLGSAQVADPISEVSRYKTWGREVLTHHDLNQMQTHFADKINEIIKATADSNYQRMTVDTLTATHSVTVASVELSKATHTHLDSHYTETEISDLLRGGTDALSAVGYSIFTHGHTAGNVTATGSAGAVQFRGSNGLMTASDDLLFTVATGTETSRLAVGTTTVSHKELTIGQPTGASEAGVEVFLKADTDESASIQFAEGTDIRQRLTMVGDDTANRLIIGPDATLGNGINVDNAGMVGIESSPDASAALTLGTLGLKFAAAASPHNGVQTEPYDRLDGSNGKNAAASGTHTVAKSMSDAQVTRAFSNHQGVVVWDSDLADDETVWLVYVNSAGVLRFYEDGVSPTSASGAGQRLEVSEHGITVNKNTRTVEPAGGWYAVDVEGDGFFSGSVQEDSDARYKENAQSLTGALDKIKTLDAFSYEWASDSPVGKIWADADSTIKVQSLGVSAQELKAVYPLLVRGDDESGYNVNYTRMTVVLLAAIKELEARVATLEAQ